MQWLWPEVYYHYEACRERRKPPLLRTLRHAICVRQHPGTLDASLRGLDCRSSYWSTVSLNLSTALCISSPSTPCARLCKVGRVRSASWLKSEMSTRPDSLIEETKAGTSCSSRDVQMRPMKLLVWAIRTASLIDIEARPQLATMSEVLRCWPGVVGATPSSLHRSTGSEEKSVCTLLFTIRRMHQVHSQFGCFQLSAVHTSAL